MTLKKPAFSGWLLIILSAQELMVIVQLMLLKRPMITENISLVKRKHSSWDYSQAKPTKLEVGSMKIQKLDFKYNLKFLRNKIAALIAGAAILLTACENNLEKIQAFSSPEDLPVMEATNFETLFTDSGEVRFFVKAPKLLQFDMQGTSFVEFPNGIVLIKYDEDQNVISSITADYAKNYEKEQKWEAKNNVVATNAQGDTLKTEHLIWEEKTEKIYTEEFVRIIRSDQIITGIGFQSDQTMQNWRIKNPKGTIYIEVDNTPQASQDSAQQEPVQIQQPVQTEQQILKVGN